MKKKANLPLEISLESERAKLDLGLVQISVFYPYPTTEHQQTIFRSVGYDDPKPPEIEFRVRRHPTDQVRFELNGFLRFQPASFKIETKNERLEKAIKEINAVLKDLKAQVRIALFISELETRKLFGLLAVYPRFELTQDDDGLAFQRVDRLRKQVRRMKSS